MAYGLVGFGLLFSFAGLSVPPYTSEEPICKNCFKYFFPYKCSHNFAMQLY